MLKLFGIYAAVFFTMVVIDMVWLRVIAVQWYANAMGSLLSDSPNLVAATAFYLLFPMGLVIFAVVPGETSSTLKVMGLGALFGFFAYATYDLTALAVIKNWPVGLTLLDMAWGTLVSGIAAGAGKLALDFLERGQT